MVDRKLETIKELSAITGVNRNVLAKVLSNKATPSAQTMIRIVEGLHLDPAVAGEIFFKRKLT